MSDWSALTRLGRFVVVAGVGAVLIVVLVMTVGCMLDLKIKVDPPTFQAIPVPASPAAAGSSVATSS